MPETMRAIDIKGGTGPADALYIAEIPKPKPTGAQALVKVKAFGLNRMDLLQREGKYPVPPQAPATLGVEFSGVIAELGEAPERGFRVGDAVFGLAYGGAYAEYLCVSTHMLVHKPAALTWAECAGIPETWITALQAMYLVGEFREGQSILWHAGASAVSIAGIQLSRAGGASRVFATARQDEKCRFVVEELGATAAFNPTKEDWAEAVLKATDGAGVDVIVDFVGANYLQGNLNAAARDGRIVCLGVMGGVVAKELDISAFVRKRVRVEGSTLRSRDVEYQAKLRDQLVERALPKFVDGTFKVYVEKIFRFEEIVEAHKLMESNQTKGKIICVID